jgi:cyclic beta-1,2-glucan synthetase
MSISGDFPIFAICGSATSADIEIVGKALRCRNICAARAAGRSGDRQRAGSSYVQDLQNAIDQLCENSRLRGSELGPRQHIFAVRRDLMDERSYKTLIASARVVLHTRNGKMFDQIERAEAAAMLAQVQATFDRAW